MTERSPLDAALAYRARGWSAIPATRRGKRAAVPWRAYQEHLPEESDLRDWFAEWPDANVAIVTGAVSGLVVLDIDPEHGGAESLAELTARHGALQDTVEARTGSGGRHLYFGHPGGAVPNRTGLAPGIDLRGDGGMVIAPPSVHPSGGRYRWRAGHAPGQAALAPLPRWLAEPSGGSGERRGHSLDHWREVARSGVTEGQRNETLASFTGHLLWHGVDPEVVMELMLAWNRDRCSPPLPASEVIDTVRSIRRTHERNRDDGG